MSEDYERYEEFARQKKSNDAETAKILKESLTIVDQLAKLDVDDIIDNSDDLQFLIEKARKLTKHRLWKLK